MDPPLHPAAGAVSQPAHRRPRRSKTVSFRTPPATGTVAVHQCGAPPPPRSQAVRGPCHSGAPILFQRRLLPQQATHLHPRARAGTPVPIRTGSSPSRLRLPRVQRATRPCPLRRAVVAPPVMEMETAAAVPVKEDQLAMEKSPSNKFPLHPQSIPVMPKVPLGDLVIHQVQQL